MIHRNHGVTDPNLRTIILFFYTYSPLKKLFMKLYPKTNTSGKTQFEKNNTEILNGQISRHTGWGKS